MDDKFLASAVAKMKTEARAAPAAPAAGSSPATAAAPASATKVGVAEARPSGAVGVGGSAAGGAWDLEAAIPLEDAANAAQDQAKRKEKLVKGMLQKQMMSVADQQQRLNKVRVELEKLEMPIRRDVDEIRSRVEVVDRELSMAIADLKQKKADFLAAEARAKSLQEKKSSMVEHLRMVIHDGESRRAGKLEALMKELGGMDISEMKPFAGFSEDGKN